MADGVYKRGNVWWIRIEFPKNEDGSRKRHSEACPGMNHTQAKKYRDKLVAEMNQGICVDHNDQTVKEYLISWLTQYESQVAATTLETYTYAVRKQLIPHIGTIKLSKLRPVSIQAMYKKLLDDDKLSAKTIKNVHGVLHKALDQAIKLQMIHYNPADSVECPRMTRKEVNPMHIEDLGRLVSAIESSQFRVPILIALATGMRRGEVLGIKWDDVDFENNLIIVRRSIAQVKGGVFEKEPKSGRPRVVRIPECLTITLKSHMADQQARSLYKKDGWICVRDDGSVQTPRAIGNAFTRLKETHGFDFTMHGLRHAQATVLISGKVPVKVVSERLGHANTNITQDIYTHVLPHMQDEAVTIIDELLSPFLNQESDSGVQNGYKKAIQPAL